MGLVTPTVAVAVPACPQVTFSARPLRSAARVSLAGYFSLPVSLTGAGNGFATGGVGTGGRAGGTCGLGSYGAALHDGREMPWPLAIVVHAPSEGQVVPERAIGCSRRPL